MGDADVLEKRILRPILSKTRIHRETERTPKIQMPYGRSLALAALLGHILAAPEVSEASPDHFVLWSSFPYSAL